MRGLLHLVALAALVALASCEAVEQYRGHKLLAAWPKDAAQVEALRAVGKWRDVDVFSHHVSAGKKVVMLVPPVSLPAAQKVLAAKDIKFQIENNDVQESVTAERRRQEISMTGRAGSALPTFERYMRYSEIQQFLKQTAEDYPSLVELGTAGQSVEKRDMWYVRISKNGGQSDRAIIVDAGIHAREWIAPPVAIYIIQQLTQDASGSSAALLDNLDWYIMPLVNPDGYEYTHTKDRFWRKNRNMKNSRWCPGTDLNRNFGFHFAQAGVSDWPCDETYAGPKAFSEVESDNLAKWIKKSNAANNVKMYLTLHSYGPMILYPWGYDYNLPDAPDKDELVSIANEANEAMIKAGSEAFEVENSAGLYPAAGASDDWTKGDAGIAKTYTIELPGGGSNGFDLPADKIIPVVTSVFEGIKVFATRAKAL